VLGLGLKESEISMVTYTNYVCTKSKSVIVLLRLF
jgi:hypothetical protein